jgi:hypothetical protein
MIEFVSFRGSLSSNQEQQYILFVFNELLSYNSYYTTLQLLYNNNIHGHSPFNLCSFQQLQQLLSLAFSKSKKLYIQGSIHDNHHSSNLLLDYNNNPLFVKDRYIRLMDENRSLYHILLYPPTLTTDTPYIFNFQNLYNCDLPSYVIHPLYS